MSAYGHTADDSFDPRPFAPQLFQLATDSNDHCSLKAELDQVKDKPTARDLVSLFDNDWITSRGMVTRISKGDAADGRRGAYPDSAMPRAENFAALSTRSKLELAHVLAGLARRIAEILMPQARHPPIWLSPRQCTHA